MSGTPMREYEDVYAEPAVPVPSRGMALVAPDQVFQQTQDQLADWAARRRAIVHFLANTLIEAEYATGKGGKRYIKRDQPPYDFYQQDGSWKLTKDGAAKVAAFASLYPATPRTDVILMEPDLVVLSCSVEIVTGNGQLRGTGVAGVSSAEDAFAKQAYKFGFRPQHAADCPARHQQVRCDCPMARGDWRGAFNVLQARGQKRARVNGIEAAVGFSEIIVEVLEIRKRQQLGAASAVDPSTSAMTGTGPSESPGPTAAPRPIPTVPARYKDFADLRIDDGKVPLSLLKKMLDECRAAGRAQWVTALETEIDVRTQKEPAA